MTLRLLRRAGAPIALTVASSGDDGTQAQDEANPEALNRQAQQLYPVSYFEATIAEQALAVAERKFGPAHPVVAYGLNNLATLYFVQGRYANEATPTPVTENKGDDADLGALSNSIRMQTAKLLFGTSDD